MKKILVMAVMMLSSVAMFAQTEAGKLTVQPKVVWQLVLNWSMVLPIC